MSNSYQSPLKRWDVIAGILQSSGIKRWVDVGYGDGRVISAVCKALPDVAVTAVRGGVLEEKVQDKYDDNTSGLMVESVDMTSALAALTVPDEQDFVFIEGTDPQNASDQIRDWIPKLRKGGIIVIGNYKHQEGIPVMRAVAEHFPLFKVAVFPDNVAMVTV